MTTTIRSAIATPFLLTREGRLERQLRIEVTNEADPVTAIVSVTGCDPMSVQLKQGTNQLEVYTPSQQTARDVEVTVDTPDGATAKARVALDADRKWELYLLHHSHNDIGYTRAQEEVLKLHWGYYEEAIDLAAKTAGYPPEARFRWNTEAFWAVDEYLRQASQEKRDAFVAAVKQGSIGLDALYGNELTALCRPEELYRLCDYSRRISEQWGVTIDAAMISDVPGYTWGMVPALAQSGVKYLSAGPNYITDRNMGPHGGFRVGYTLKEWGDRPAYWVSPSGKERILLWVSTRGYSAFHLGRKLSEERLIDMVGEVVANGFDYDILKVRYTVEGDNGPTDPSVSDFVKDWNERYTYPKLILSTTSELFHAFEDRYGDQLPEIRGDFTPYWEDGAASTARETGINRAAAERLVQGEALWAMLNPAKYPDELYYDAWRNALLYDEHTWGAHCSESQPDSEFTKVQWAWKQKRALLADDLSQEGLATALQCDKRNDVSTINVYNTNSWTRTDLVILSAAMSTAGDRVLDHTGQPVPSQRLSTGELAFLARDVPSFGASRYTIVAGVASGKGLASAQSTRLANGQLEVEIDPASGVIKTLKRKGETINYADTSNGVGLNSYYYVAGRDHTQAVTNGAVKIRVKERGPLVASLVVESAAPGCRQLTRELRLVDGLAHLEIRNVIDKEQVRTKEGVHLGFAFNVPDGVVRMDVPWAVVRPNEDQLKGSNKNFFTVQRWVDIANNERGVTWATVEAPLIELGQMWAEEPNRHKTKPWLKELPATQTIYSYVMNNYWFTNYKADQEGPTPFTYAIRLHDGYDATASQRFGIERSQPLVAASVRPESAAITSPLRVDSEAIIVTSLKPSRDSQAIMVRLFNTSDKPASAQLEWSKPAPSRVTISSPFEMPGKPTPDTIEMAPGQIVTLRAELSQRVSSK